MTLENCPVHALTHSLTHSCLACLGCFTSDSPGAQGPVQATPSLPTSTALDGRWTNEWLPQTAHDVLSPSSPDVSFASLEL